MIVIKDVAAIRLIGISAKATTDLFNFAELLRTLKLISVSGKALLPRRAALR